MNEVRLAGALAAEEGMVRVGDDWVGVGGN